MNNDNTIESENIEVPTITYLENLLGENTVFHIPLFQRDYSWTERNCVELFDDIIDGMKKGNKHFIGIFMDYNVGTASGNLRTNVLIDGQQRLTSIILLLCAIRDVSKDQSLKKSIDDFIRVKSNKTPKFKLKQTNIDDPVFEKILNVPPNDYDSSNMLYKNYCLFKELIHAKKGLKHFDLFKYIKELETIEIVLKNKSINNVQKIFEKINSTGVPLSTADLIRNYALFVENPKEQADLHKMWLCMESLVGKDNIVKFVRAYTIRYSKKVVNVDDVFREFKEAKYKDKKKDIMKDMLKYATYYSIIENVDYKTFDSNYNVIPLKINKHTFYFDNTLRLLNKVRIDDFVPLILQLFDLKFKNDFDTLDDILELLLEFIIRYRICKTSGGGGSINNKIYEIMRKIDDNKLKVTLNKIYTELSSFSTDATAYPNNEKFISAMRTDMYTEVGRVLLFHYARIKQKDFNNIIFDKNISLEHLMPKTIEPGNKDGDWWIEHLGTNIDTIRKDYTDCIGNYGLLSIAANTINSNQKWPEKRKNIANWALHEETKKVAESETWNETDIIDRNDSLSAVLAQYITGPKEDEKKYPNWILRRSNKGREQEKKTAEDK